MKNYNPKKPLFSIHIPKCAGASFSEILKAWFKKGFLRHYKNEKLNKPPEKYNFYTGFLLKKLKPNLCVHGHFNNNRGIGISDYYPEAEQFITILRDPFDIHVSNYFYVKLSHEKNKSGGAFRSGKKHPIIENGWNLEDYLDKGSKKSYILNFLPSSITLDNYQKVLENQFIYI